MERKKINWTVARPKGYSRLFLNGPLKKQKSIFKQASATSAGQSRATFPLFAPTPRNFTLIYQILTAHWKFVIPNSTRAHPSGSQLLRA